MNKNNKKKLIIAGSILTGFLCLVIICAALTAYAVHSSQENSNNQTSSESREPEVTSDNDGDIPTAAMTNKYYLADCKIWEVAGAELVEVEVAGFPTADISYCTATPAGNSVSTLIDRYVFISLSDESARSSDRDYSRDWYKVDLVDKKAQKLEVPVLGEGRRQNGIVFGYDESNSRIYSLVMEYDESDFSIVPALYSSTNNGRSYSKLVEYPARTGAYGRGGIVGDEFSITVSPNSEYLLVNDTIYTLDGEVEEREKSISLIDLTDGDHRLIDRWRGTIARWTTDNNIVYIDYSIVFGGGDGDITLRNAATGEVRVVAPDFVGGWPVDMRLDENQIYLTHSSGDNYATSSIALTTAESAVVAPGAFAVVASNDTDSATEYVYLEIKKCERTDFENHDRDASVPGAVFCSPGDSSGAYAYRFMKTVEGSDPVVVKEFAEILYPF